MCWCQGKFQIKHSITTKCRFGKKAYQCSSGSTQMDSHGKRSRLVNNCRLAVRPKTSCFSNYPRPCDRESIIDLSSNSTSSFPQKTRLQVSAPLVHQGVFQNALLVGRWGTRHPNGPHPNRNLTTMPTLDLDNDNLKVRGFNESEYRLSTVLHEAFKGQTSILLT